MQSTTFKSILVFSFCLIQIIIKAQPNAGIGTYFDGIATPYGGCGIPENRLESPYYVALDVYDSPGVGTMWTRPLQGADTAYMGEFENGKNCGRWVKVTILENCLGGINDGALGLPFCRNGGTWTPDGYYGATMNLLVTDACGDNNAWCRDNKYHLDIRRSALARFNKNDTLTTNLVPINWNNRKISWEYIEAPNYQGDVNIYFIQAAQQYWPAITINNLKNGIHGVQQKINGQWVDLTMNSDMGQSYIMKIVNGNGPYTIRIIDASDNFVNGGREYTFSNSCNPIPCNPITTPVSYTTTDPNPLPLTYISASLEFINSQSVLKFIVNETENGTFYIFGNDYYGESLLINEIKSNKSAQRFYQINVPFLFESYQVIFKNTEGIEVKSNFIRNYGKTFKGQLVQVENRLFKIMGLEESSYSVVVKNSIGQIVSTSTNNPSTFQLNDLANGIYLVLIKSENEHFIEKIWLH